MSREEAKNMVTRNGLYLANINDQTEEICEAAIEQNPYAIKYVQDKSIELCLTALTLSRGAQKSYL